jgi:hypothetical protein
MHFYVRPFGLFAIFIDFYIDKNQFKLYSVNKFQGEIILDILHMRIIWTPRSVLKTENSNVYKSKNKSAGNAGSGSD